MMDAAIEPFEAEVRKVQLRPPTLPIFSSVTARPLDDQTATDPVYWARQIREPVRFSEALANILNDQSGHLVLLETGPNQALSTLAKQQPLDLKRHHVLPSLPHAKQTESDARFFVSTIGKLWQAGSSITWTSVYDGELRNRLHLPLYRFQRERHSFEDELVQAEPDTDSPQDEPTVLAAGAAINQDLELAGSTDGSGSECLAHRKWAKYDHVDRDRPADGNDEQADGTFKKQSTQLIIPH